MAKIKGWYKLRDGKQLTIYKHLEKNIEIHIGNTKNRAPGMLRNEWRVTLAENHYSAPGQSWKFTTQAKAKAFARRYMRTHPR